MTPSPAPTYCPICNRAIVANASTPHPTIPPHRGRHGYPCPGEGLQGVAEKAEDKFGGTWR